MTFGFQQGSVPPGREREAVNMCLVISPVVESMIYSVPNSRIIWDHPDTQAVLVENLGKAIINDQGYQSNQGGIRKY